MLRINNVSIHFGGKPLFDKMTFQIVKGERIGLTGKNGAGKSTLLNMIMGHLSPSEGNLETPTTYSIGHLSQDLDEVSDLTVLEEAKKAFVALNNLEAEIEEVQNQLVTRTDYESDSYMSLINDLTEKEQLLHQLGGQNTEELIEKVLKGLGFVSSDMTKLVSSLSGGWQMRVELAKILLQQPDLILLDEPTNHLDIESIIWLEEYLTTYPGSVLVVSHDKAFLDNVTNRTIEIVLGKIEDYKCNYSKYLVQRQERIEKQQQAKKNQEDFIKQTERNIEKFRAKASKAKFAQSLIKKLDKLEVIEVDGSDNSSMNFKFQEPNRSGDIVVKVENASKAFGDNQVLKNVNLEINRGEKVAFVGKNGMGKTTLARMILNEIDYDGNINLGHNVEVGFFAQHQAEILDGNRTVFETIDDAATNEMRTRVRSLLGSFLFSGDDTEKKVKVLSGGERNRLALCKMLLEPANLLVLDEPTNHLDMVSKDKLKQAINNYTGTVIVVSHDRDFLQGLTEKVVEFKDQNIKEHIGDINEFLSKREVESFREFEQNKKIEEQKKAPKEKKNLHKQRKEFKSVEKKIETLEKKISEFEARLKDYDEYQKIQEDPTAFKTHEENKAKLDELMERWEILSIELEE